MKDVPAEGFSGTQAAKVVGISYRQLDYWARTDLVTPELGAASGSGSRRRYSYQNLLELRIIKALLDGGIKLESVRKVFQYLRERVTGDVASAHLVIVGQNVVLCENDQLTDVVNQGQGVLNIIPMAGVFEDVENGILPIDSPDQAPPERPTTDETVTVRDIRPTG